MLHANVVIGLGLLELCKARIQDGGQPWRRPKKRTFTNEPSVWGQARSVWVFRVSAPSSGTSCHGAERESGAESGGGAMWVPRTAWDKGFD